MYLLNIDDVPHFPDGVRLEDMTSSSVGVFVSGVFDTTDMAATYLALLLPQRLIEQELNAAAAAAAHDAAVMSGVAMDDNNMPIGVAMETDVTSEDPVLTFGCRVVCMMRGGVTEIVLRQVNVTRDSEWIYS